MSKLPIPEDFPVRPIGPDDTATDPVTCGTCGLTWDDAVSTSWTPAPSGRCPFEYFHADSERRGDVGERAAAANLAAKFHRIVDLEAGELPAIETAGAMAFLYVDEDDGALMLSLDLDTVAGWLVREDGTVPVLVAVNGTTVFDDTDAARRYVEQDEVTRLELRMAADRMAAEAAAVSARMALGEALLAARRLYPGVGQVAVRVDSGEMKDGTPYLVDVRDRDGNVLWSKNGGLVAELDMDVEAYGAWKSAAEKVHPEIARWVDRAADYGWPSDSDTAARVVQEYDDSEPTGVFRVTFP